MCLFAFLDSFSQVKINKANSKFLKYTFTNDSSINAFFLPPYPFVIPQGKKSKYKLFIRKDRIQFNKDTMLVFLSDTSFVNIFEEFNFQDSLAKSAGIYRYAYILPHEVASFELYIAIPNKAKYLKLFYNFSYVEDDRNSFQYKLIQVPY
jgi:hypothetical protein